LVWTTGGSNNVNWTNQATVGAFDGIDDAESGSIGNSQATWIETSVTGPGTLGFWWKVFSEPDADFLVFYNDGNLIDEISGDTSATTHWQYRQYDIPSGTHTLRWQYEKDESFNEFPDKGYLDHVTFTTNEISLQQALDTCGVAWTTNAFNTTAASWVGQTNVTHNGVDAAESGAVYGTVSAPQESWLQTSVNGATNVSFWWKVSSSTNQDHLEFFIDSTQKTNITGEVNWRSNFFTIPNGAQTLKWRYVKSNSIAVGSDRGWVDQVVLRPVRTAFPYGLTASPGYTNNQFQFTVVGEVGCTCRVDFSTNLALTNWTTLGTFVTTNAANQFTDSGAAPSPQRFYRTVSP
jgi:hypothetical protein